MEKQKIFSKGDIVVDNVADVWEYVLLLKSDVYDDPDCEIKVSCYVRLERYTGDTSVIELSMVENPWAERRYCMDMRFANEKERRTLLDTIDAYNHIIDKETLMLLPKLPKKEKEQDSFETFEHVLVRDSADDVWRPGLFGFKDDNSCRPYNVSGLYWEYCIPYEGNEHLKGTMNNYNENN